MAGNHTSRKSGIQDCCYSTARPNKERPASFRLRAARWTVWVDQEVVALCAPPRLIAATGDRAKAWPLQRTPGLNHRSRRRDLTPDAINPTHRSSCEASQSNRPKSQPPHLVFCFYYRYCQNLSSDHLLSGVTAE